MYSEFDPQELTLRDHLARDRTILANERTFLSYLRTGFGVAAGGVTLLKLFPSDLILWWLGISLSVAGGLITLVGIWRFVAISQSMRRILQPTLPATGGSDGDLSDESPTADESPIA